VMLGRDSRLGRLHARRQKWLSMIKHWSRVSNRDWPS
jgi:hypothetical protein